MNLVVFQKALDARIAPYDLLNHPFYQAWTSGKLSLDQLRAYAAEYFHHVAAFPTFLSALHSRLADGAMRRAVLRNLAEEEIEGRAHSDMWLDFAEGVGLSSQQVRSSQPGPSISRLIQRFHRSARQDSPAEVIAALYAYESQVPRISGKRAVSCVITVPMPGPADILHSIPTPMSSTLRSGATNSATLSPKTVN